MKIRLADGTELSVDYAAVGTLTGQLSFVLTGSQDFATVYALLSNAENTQTIEYLDGEGSVTETYTGYTVLSMLSLDVLTGDIRVKLGRE